MVVLVALTGTAHSAMLCARPRSDGTFSTSIKLREACKPSEVELGIVTLDPLRLHGPTTTSSTTTSTSSTTTMTALDGDLTQSIPAMGLMWELKRDLDGVEDYGDPHDSDNRYTWTDPGDSNLTNPDGTMWTVFIPTLNTPPCFAGHCDWRMPTVAEMVTMGSSYALPANPNGGYWTSETYSGDTTHGRPVQGGTDYHDPKTFNLFVRAVRDLP
jgi:hypothetical protein